MSEATKKGDLALLDKAVLHQQRRLKQATLFTHKDSADLLPLDGLKRLGTTKDLQPHNIIQRRLIEGSAPRLRAEAQGDGSGGLGLGGLGGGPVRSPLVDHKKDRSGEGAEEQRSESTAGDSAEERDSPEESEESLRSEEEEEEEEEDSSGGEAAAKPLTPTVTPGVKEEREEEEEEEEEEGGTASPTTLLVALVVQCKCGEADVRASIDTGCQHNHISSVCCRRLGLVAEQDSAGAPRTVRGLQLQLGTQRVLCSAHVKDDEVSELCLGLQTLLELKCCVDLSGRVLRLQGSGEELPFLVLGAGGSSLRRRHDTNENL